tara:strand:- start:31 stop:834 length:804 start_codon:yes stop_codon:yes gene_type:complete
MLNKKFFFIYFLFLYFSNVFVYAYSLPLTRTKYLLNNKLQTTKSTDYTLPIHVIEPYYRDYNKYKNNVSCILFFTGGSSFITPQIYNNFFNKLSNNNFAVYTPSFNYKNISDLINILSENYKEVIIAGHSSGATVALNNCYNDKIKKLILLDPVNTRIFNISSLFSIPNISSIIYFNAMKSYKITFDPLGLPFIPFLRIKNNNLDLNKNCSVVTIDSENFGHADILDKSYGDFMHFTRIAVGNKNRSLISIDNYHKWISDNIKNLFG